MSRLMSEVARPLTADELDRWIDGLDSGEHEQSKGSLRSERPSAETGKYGYCCLGLKCSIDKFNLEDPYNSYEDCYTGDTLHDYFWEHSGLGFATDEDDHLPDPLHGLSYTTRNSLANANDSTSFPHTFPMIAAVLRQYREALLEGKSLSFSNVDGTWTVVG